MDRPSRPAAAAAAAGLPMSRVDAVCPRGRRARDYCPTASTAADGQQQCPAPTKTAGRECRDLKVVLVGDKGVGKTALIHQFVFHSFPEVYTPTNFDTYSHVCDVGGTVVNFALWDTSGSHTSDRVRPLAYAAADIFLVCFSIGDPDSLAHAMTKWYPEIRAHCESTPILLCGCGSDLRNDIDTISDLAKEQRIPVTSEQALRVCRRMEAMTYVETSAKTGASRAKAVRDAFEMAALAAMGKLNGGKGFFSLLNHHRINFCSSSTSSSSSLSSSASAAGGRRLLRLATASHSSSSYTRDNLALTKEPGGSRSHPQPLSQSDGKHDLRPRPHRRGGTRHCSVM